MPHYLAQALPFRVNQRVCWITRGRERMARYGRVLSLYGDILVQVRTESPDVLPGDLLWLQASTLRDYRQDPEAGEFLRLLLRLAITQPSKKTP